MLRTVLTVAGLLPPEHWSRMLPPRGPCSEPPELNYSVISLRRDGYRIVSYGLERSQFLRALAPDGARLCDSNGDGLGWVRVEDAERSIDRNYPMVGAR